MERVCVWIAEKATAAEFILVSYHAHSCSAANSIYQVKSRFTTSHFYIITLTINPIPK